MTAPAPMRIARNLVADLRTLLLWWLGVVALVAAALWTAAGLVDLGEFDGSVWEPIAVSLRYAPLVAGILMAGVQLPLHVLHGVARGRFFTGAALAGLAVCAGVTVFVVLGFAAEHLVYGAQGRPHVLDQPFPLSAYQRPDDYPAIAAVTLAAFAAHYVSGWLIGLGYLRFGPLRATLFIAPAALPMVVTESSAASGWLGIGVNVALADGRPLLPGGLLTCAAVIAAGTAAVWLLNRDAPIRTANLAWWR
ncbi:hypothetical protein [Allonocardiopsis opalescens]|uniref:Uncharacterized protein n=1 Tax=Allonocardiopsis opalescens TaxID=1144618 RepID=A0A2T0Q4L1_9ACTN|nr:hypothetical protein [Allonocardiopsis opalescens]PRX98720.1 hypothetical protein CLV72_104299 [Allonocardiopsis opalescens]